ncbi:MAG: energy transducer TonB [Alphaproteobacteria bacterium]
MGRFTWALLILALSASAATEPALAQYSGVEPPQIIHRVTPIYPQAAEIQGDEAWLTVRFTVKADGTTANAKIVDGFYSHPFEVAMLDSVAQWRFKPATENGNPIDWDDSEFSEIFLYNDIPGGAYPIFTQAYSTVKTLLGQKDFSGAKSKITDMIAQHQVRLLYEYAFAEMALYEAELGLGNDQAALRAVYRATPPISFNEREEQAPELGTRISTRVQLPKNGLLPDKPQQIALRDRFFIDNKLGQYVDALETYDRLAALAKLPPDDPFTKQANAIKAAFASPAPFSVPAKIDEDSWSYRPARRTFTLINVKGSITALGVVCERRIATLPYQPDVEWTLPAAWGRCELEIRGTAGTEFSLVEFAAQAPGSPAPQ